MRIERALAGDRAFAADVQRLERIELPGIRDPDAHAHLRHHARIGHGPFHAAVVERQALVLIEVGKDRGSLRRPGREHQRRAGAHVSCRRRDISAVGGEQRRCRHRYRPARDRCRPARSPGTSSGLRGWPRGCSRWSLLRPRSAAPASRGAPAAGKVDGVPDACESDPSDGARPQPSVPLSNSTNPPTTTRRTRRAPGGWRTGHRNGQNVQMKCVNADSVLQVSPSVEFSIPDSQFLILSSPQSRSVHAIACSSSLQHLAPSRSFHVA